MFVVAGATGRTGRVVAETLLAQGNEVRVIVRDASQGAAWNRRGAQSAVLSLDDGEALARALRGAKGFHTLLPEDPCAEDFHGHRRRMAEAIAAAVAASGVPHVVLLSAIAAVVPDGNGPAKDLHHAERVLRSSGSRITAIRASSFQENVAAALGAAEQEGIYPNFLPSADVRLPTVATRDVGRLAARCLLEPPAQDEIVDLVGPAYSVRELADRLGAALGKSLRVVDIPAVAHVQALVQAGLPRPFAEALAELYACFASGRISPQGDRMVQGVTAVEEILPDLLAANAVKGSGA